MKVDMKQTDYYKSGDHTRNAKTSSKKGLAQIRKNYERKVSNYYLNPNKCELCQKVIHYDKRYNKFCSKLCSSKVNSSKRSHSTCSKTKIGESLRSNWESLDDHEKMKRSLKCLEGTRYAYCRLYKVKCLICSRIKLVGYHKKDRKTCGSEDCRVRAVHRDRVYQNRRKRLYKYFDQIQGKEVFLDSSWELEVAKELDSLKIRWTRPQPIRWCDSKGKKRYYYADFYLLDFEVYLDPKNPYCLKKDEEKIEKISKIVDLRVGSLESIMNYIRNL